MANPAKPAPKPYQRPPGKKRSDSERKAEGKEKAIVLQKQRDDKAANLRRMTPSAPAEQVENAHPREGVEDTPRSKRPNKATRHGDDHFRQEDVHQNVDDRATESQDPFQAEPPASSHSRNSSQVSDWLHRSQDAVSDDEGPPRQPSPSPVYIPATQLERMMNKLQASLQKDFNDKIAELEKQKDRDRRLFLEKERSFHERLKAARHEHTEEQNLPGFSGPTEYEEFLRLRAEKSRRGLDKPAPPPGREDMAQEQGREGQREEEDEMDEDNDLVIPEGTTPLPSTPIDLTACPPYHCTKDIVFEGVDPAKVDCYLAQENTFFLVCLLGCNALLRNRNTGPNILIGLRRERNDVDTSNMTIAATAPQLVDKKGHMQLPSLGKPPHTLILSDVPPKLERVIQSKHVFIYSPGMAFIALSAQDITTPRETFMGMLHAGNSSNAIRHNDPANASLHRVMMTMALSQSQPVRDAVVHLYRCKQNEVDTCVAENIDTLTLRPAYASVKAKNVPPTTGYAIYMTPPRTAPKDAIATWIAAVKDIQVEHPKMVLSYHIRRDFKCRICKDVSHNDPDCPWPKTDGYLGPKIDTIFGKSDKTQAPTKTGRFQNRSRGRRRG
ncbi:hypothetical protein IW261DRAFT_1575513 [Armillaria novae-zelandiae]|uniref:Uncharacterized protein n=1 Tax=Armillaria novae-zelandiae TaxID=153914 RepID=A0AA39TZQ0_9AGAR|nr:hypothetical protein IW261DRAFT_1575513 [Armillaria novae-zelandiae]